MDRSVFASATLPSTVFLYRRPILDEWAELGDVTLGDLIAHVLIPRNRPPLRPVGRGHRSDPGRLRRWTPRIGHKVVTLASSFVDASWGWVEQ